MKGVYVKENPNKKDFYSVDRIEDLPRTRFKVIDKLSERCVYNKGSMLSLIDVGTKFYPVGAGILFKIIFSSRSSVD